MISHYRTSFYVLQRSFFSCFLLCFVIMPTLTGFSQKQIFSAKQFQHLMLNHWVLTVEPTDKAFEGACFANTKQKDIFFKNRGPTINSLHKYVFTAHQREHLCKLTGLKKSSHSRQSKQNSDLRINAAEKNTETMVTNS